MGGEGGAPGHGARLDRHFTRKAEPGDADVTAAMACGCAVLVGPLVSMRRTSRVGWRHIHCLGRARWRCQVVCRSWVLIGLGCAVVGCSNETSDGSKSEGSNVVEIDGPV